MLISERYANFERSACTIAAVKMHNLARSISLSAAKNKKSMIARLANG